MRPTIKDIAEAAGVTHGVVSSVLNSTGRVRASVETAKRIREVARELGYRPSTFARAFRNSETKAIGVLHGDGRIRLRFDSGSRYFASLMDGILDGAFLHGYTVAMCPRLLGDASIEALADGRFDGYIWYSTNPFEAAVQAIRDCPYPIVLIHSPASEFDYKFPTVICDNAGGIRLAIDHLAELGHRKISFASNSSFEFGESKIRKEAFLEYGAELGLELSLVDMHLGKEKAVETWLKDRHYTSLVAHNEGLAAELMSAFQASGVQVPGDLSIIGFDSTDFCLMQTPHLTSIYQPVSELGEVGVERLVEMIAGKNPQIETILPCRLDVRGSTGAAK